MGTIGAHLGSKSGRTWTFGTDDVVKTKTETILVRLPEGSIPLKDDDVANLAGVPKIGDEHKTLTGLFVTAKKIVEGGDSDKHIIQVEITYDADSNTMSEKNSAPRGQDIQSLGWSASTVTRDYCGEDGVLLNSAGQPFDSAPQVDVICPVFTKVVRTQDRKSAWVSKIGKVNSEEITVDGITCGKNTLKLIKCDEIKLWDNEFGFEYEYSIEAQILHTPVKLKMANEPTDIGWQIAITDAGCYELVGEENDDGAEGNKKLKRIAYPDAETGKLTYATTPQLLDGDGKAQQADSAVPYNTMVDVCEKTDFDGEIFSVEPKKFDEINKDDD